MSVVTTCPCYILTAVDGLVLNAMVDAQRRLAPLALLNVSQGVGYLGLHERLLRTSSENMQYAPRPNGFGATLPAMSCRRRIFTSSQ